MDGGPTAFERRGPRRRTWVWIMVVLTSLWPRRVWMARMSGAFLEEMGWRVNAAGCGVDGLGDRTLADDGGVEDRRLHADETAVLDAATVEDGARGDAGPRSRR